MSTAIESLLPHRAPMRWLDALVECTDTTATGTVLVTAEHFAVVEGTMLECALVECAAQTVAAALGQRRRACGDSSPAQTGMLAAVSNFQINARPAVGDTLTIEVREVKRLGPMLRIAARIVVGQPPSAGTVLQAPPLAEHQAGALGGLTTGEGASPTKLIATGELTLYA